MQEIPLNPIMAKNHGFHSFTLIIKYHHTPFSSYLRAVLTKTLPTRKWVQLILNAILNFVCIFKWKNNFKSKALGKHNESVPAHCDKNKYERNKTMPSDCGLCPT